MYVLGEDLSMNTVKQYMMKNWNFVKLPDMFYNEEGFFILRFHSFQDKHSVIMKGSYTIHNRPMMVRDWKPDFSLNKYMLRTIPLWVKLPQLPLHLWGARSLSKIGSAIGTPLVTDECTSNKLRMSYARILVEIDITQDLKSDIMIRDKKGDRLKQPIEYEWKPLYHRRCHKVGHNCEKPAKQAKELRPKVKEVQIREEVKTNVEEKMESVQSETAEEDQNDENDEWSRITSNRRDKGKGISKEGTSIHSQNGFGLLGILNDPLSSQNRVQC
ncbi:unnamed protein product [Lathyrus sativus]|nr:unnamed protein product [Lathyrus sativus]